MKTFTVCAKVPEYEENGFVFDHVELEVMVDDEDYERVMEYNWYARVHKGRRIRYTIQANVDGEKMFLHHFIFGKPPVGMLTDHKDGNGRNAQKSNFRFVTHRQNAQNKFIPKSSPYPGVHYHTREKKYRAKICVDGYEKIIGEFRSPEYAFLAYQAAVESLGETVLDY